MTLSITGPLKDRLIFAADRYNRMHEKSKDDLYCRFYDEAKKIMCETWLHHYNNDFYNLAYYETKACEQEYGIRAGRKLMKCIQFLRQTERLREEIVNGDEAGIYRAPIMPNEELQVRKFLHFADLVEKSRVYQARRAARTVFKQLVLASPESTDSLISHLKEAGLSLPVELTYKMHVWKAIYPSGLEETMNKLNELKIA